MSVADLLEGKRICVCAGSGGVGKTTTSAAIAAGMAARELTRTSVSPLASTAWSSSPATPAIRSTSRSPNLSG